ncbi:hypothetical protein I3760_16G114800 [Carya illinoinensis]|nr:hypothetical protein I3760_16G114800 [Carya illinoinensis]
MNYICSTLFGRDPYKFLFLSSSSLMMDNIFLIKECSSRVDYTINKLHLLENASLSLSLSLWGYWNFLVGICQFGVKIAYGLICFRWRMLLLEWNCFVGVPL